MLICAAFLCPCPPPPMLILGAAGNENWVKGVVAIWRGKMENKCAVIMENAVKG